MFRCGGKAWWFIEVSFGKIKHRYLMKGANKSCDTFSFPW
jgi:hypothetical protein